MLIGLCASVLADQPIDKPAADAAGDRFFESKIRPLLVQHCFECHGPDSGDGESNLRMDSLKGMLRGGKSGPAIIPGDPAQSLLMLAVRHDGTVAMPPKKKLAKMEIDLLDLWIKQGAVWTGVAKASVPAASKDESQPWSDSAKRFWAFQPIRAVQPPAVRDSHWPRNEIDQFVLSRLESENLMPAPAANKNTLLRRVTLDLVGLPPTPADLAEFLQDDSADAFDRVIDRLLHTKQYGERWARHWLDVARYADSNGMDDNLAYSDAWRYRDYVIAAFNSDKPYDRFVREQLAGDLLAKHEDTSRHDDLVIATGFLALGPKMLAEDDPVKQQLDIVDEQLDTSCRVFMALTMGCVRCHDHKFDPLSMSDYYGLAGIFSSTRTMVSFRVDSKWNTTGLGGIEGAFRLKDLEQIIDRHDNALVNGNTTAMSADEREAHNRLVQQAYKEYAALPKAMSVTEGTVWDLEIRLRGNHLTRGAAVSRRFPTILGDVNARLPDRTQSGRLEFARWLSDHKHPLTARVIVNRVWRWHFGQGLVATVDNFGRLGETPSHPELLDWLAARFIADGWSFKKLHALILRSQTWQMSSAWNEHAAQTDPRNRLLWHRTRQRVEAEVLRDSLLQVSGQLDLTMGGAPMMSTPFQNLSAGGISRNPELFQSNRRSIYLPVLRGSVYEVFQAFDFPDPAVLNGDRAATTVATQALFMLNGRLVEQSARRLRELILLEPAANDRERLQRLCRRVLARDASNDELLLWERFLDQYQQAPSLAEVVTTSRESLAWEGLCRSLLSTNEFIYIE